MNYDYDAIKNNCNSEAKIFIKNIINKYLSDSIKEHEYIKLKIKNDITTYSEVLFLQYIEDKLKINEFISDNSNKNYSKKMKNQLINSYKNLLIDIK